MRPIGSPCAHGRSWIKASLLALIVLLVALAGAASTGHAAASPDVSITGFKVLNDISATIPGQPSPGGNIGYDLTVANNGTSVANHLSLTETIGATGALVYVNATGVSCNRPAPSVTTLTCTISKLGVGATFEIVVLFRTDPNGTPGSNVTNHTVLAFDSQTNGQSNQKTVPLDTTRTLAGNADGSLAESISLHGEKLAADGNGQTSALTMPDGFVNNFSYVGARLENELAAPLCLGCPGFDTAITIPPASTFTSSGPFYDGLTTEPFTWTLTLPGSQVPKGFKVTGVYHDGVLIPPCSFAAGSPSPNTTGMGICVATLTVDKKTKAITATGLALANGHYQFG